jgi:hypothetical protein
MQVMMMQPLRSAAFSETSMIRTRRQFALTIAAATGLGGVLNPRRVFAQDDDVPNLFISPPGQPFRAAQGAPYPVVDWFKQADKNGDGKLDRAEFVGDAEAFFKVLDLNGDGVLDSYEIQVYERVVAPEILAGAPDVGALQTIGARLWLAQDRPGSVLPPGSDAPTEAPKPHLDESLQGAAPYSLFQAPEPVTEADVDFRGVVFKANFLQLADRHFTTLDHDNAGFLTLAKLPKTAVQIALEHAGRGRL